MIKLKELKTEYKEITAGMHGEDDDDGVAVVDRSTRPTNHPKPRRHVIKIHHNHRISDGLWDVWPSNRRNGISTAAEQSRERRFLLC